MLELWDKYHLKKLDEKSEAEIIEKINKIQELLKDYERNCYKNIENFLIENVDMGE